MHSIRVRTARLLTYPVVSHVNLGGGGLPNTNPPGCIPPGHVTCDAWWEANRPPTPRGQTNTCENIILPQTSFAIGNKFDYSN